MSYSQLKTPKATFRLLHRLEGKRAFAADLPQKFDAVLVEMVHSPPIKNLDKRVEAYISGLESNPDLQTLVKRVKRDKIKVWFGDLGESPSLSTVRDLDLMVAEVLVGLLLFWQGTKLLFKRRGVKKTKGGKSLSLKGLSLVLASFWFLSSMIEVLGTFLVRVAGNTAKKGPLKAINEAIAEASGVHPEKTVVFLRNLVMAEKAWEVTKSLLRGGRVEVETSTGTSDSSEVRRIKKPLILLDFHFGHAGLLKMLGWHSEKRRALLHLYRPFIKDILKDPVRRDYLARLISVSWDGQNWQVERNFLVDTLEEF